MTSSAEALRRVNRRQYKAHGVTPGMVDWPPVQVSRRWAQFLVGLIVGVGGTVTLLSLWWNWRGWTLIWWCL